MPASASLTRLLKNSRIRSNKNHGARLRGFIRLSKNASQNFVRKGETKLNLFFAPACTKRKIQIGLQVWNLFAFREQIMRAADLPAHRVSGGISVKILRRSILTDSKNHGARLRGFIFSKTRDVPVGAAACSARFSAAPRPLPLGDVPRRGGEDFRLVQTLSLLFYRRTASFLRQTRAERVSVFYPLCKQNKEIGQKARILGCLDFFTSGELDDILYM